MKQRVTLDWSEKQVARFVGHQRHVGARERGLTRTTSNRGAPPEADSSEAAKIKDMHAAGAEMAVAKLLGLFWSPALLTQTKEVADVGKDIQVRHTTLNSGCLIVAPEDPDEHTYYLATGELPTFMIHGPIRGEAAKRKVWLRNPGERGRAYFVPQNAL